MMFWLLILGQVAWGAGNPKYAGTPYENISIQNLKVLKENTTRRDQVSDFNEVDFFVVENNDPVSKNPFPIAEVELEFSCPQSKAASGWFISLWKHYADNSEINESDRKPLKSYDVSPDQCKDKTFTLAIDANETGTANISSYYIGVQGGCSTFPNLRRYYYEDKPTVEIPCDRSDYRLKLGLVPKAVIADTNTLSATELKNAIPLGSIKTGQISSMNDKNIYSVETYSTYNTAGTNEVPLLFSCTATAARYTNDWKLTVYDDKNTVVTGYPRYINGSDCGSTLVDDKGGFKFTLPKDSPRYFVSVQSACDSQSKKNCTVETSQYNIARDVTKIYTGSLSATKSITAKSSSFKLTRCGLNANSTIAVKVENADLTKMFSATKLVDKKPIKIQIGTMACQFLTPNSFVPAELMLGSITDNAEIIDAPLIAKDSATVTLGECISSNKPDVASKITITGTKLDLENLNPTEESSSATTVTPANNSVVIPVKVDIGDFHCEGREAFYIETDKPKVGDTTYSNHLQTDDEISTTTDTTPAVGIFDSNWITTKKNLGASQTNRITSLTDAHVYQVDTGTTDANLTFTCLNSVRYQNDWKVLIYDSEKKLKTTTLINGSSCGLGQIGDTGAYAISLTKDSPTYYLVVKSACDSNDTTCKIDDSQYMLQRVTPTQAAAIEAAKPCFGAGCTTTTTVKPFFK